jgi:hypothetical protein
MLSRALEAWLFTIYEIVETIGIDVHTRLSLTMTANMFPFTIV